jgi:hypothetical protein
MTDAKVMLVTIKFKKRGILPNEFTVRLASTDFTDTYTVRQLIDEGYRKLRFGKLSANFFLRLPQRILGYGKYIGFNTNYVLAVYTEKDKGRIDLEDIAKHVLVTTITFAFLYVFLGIRYFLMTKN